MHSTVALFVNWLLFAIPGISLDEINIPVIQLSEGTLPSAKEVSSLVEAVRENLRRLSPRVSSEQMEEIEAQLNMVSFDPHLLQKRFSRTSMLGEHSGTQFYIQPTDVMLEMELDSAPQRRRIGDLQKTLMGFTNTMLPDAAEPPIVGEFWDHPSQDLQEAIIGPEEFFTPADFQSADHQITGTFDDYGQFLGTVSIYGDQPQPHTIAWPEAAGRRTDCGPFNINFAYVQGAARDSRIPHDQWAKLISKLDRFGGLYIYRNNIRILPYGNTDYDFLQIEERRNLGAAYYFFSYRRMFGVIDLPSDSSLSLVEKAGREGFRDNRAYRQFRSMLENFFVQLAADYFRDDKRNITPFTETKQLLNRQAKARAQQERRSGARRRELNATLQDNGARLTSEEPMLAVQTVLQRLGERLAGAKHITDLDRQVKVLVDAESTARKELHKLRADYRIPLPKGVGLPRTTRRNLDAYQLQYTKMEEEVLTPAFLELEQIFSTVLADLDAVVDQRRIFESGVNSSTQVARSSVLTQERMTRSKLLQSTQYIRHHMQATVSDFESDLSKIAQRIQRTSIANLQVGEFVNLRLAVDTEIEELANRQTEVLEAIFLQLESITTIGDGSDPSITNLDVTEAIEEQLIELQDRADFDLELTQLGMAIGIIDHEFQATIRSIRRNLQRFKAWADVNDQLSELYNNLRINFDHLDSYLTLFTPLHRRLYRKETQIKGSEIAKFLFDLFKERFERHHIDAKTTQAFRSHRLYGFPSMFYPVFVNLIDNAVFWLANRPLPRTILLDANNDAMLVIDNGPGIPPQDRDAVFEMGFTRKPGGRGLGLYISRDVLARIEYELAIDNPIDDQGAVFRIQPKAHQA